MQAKSVHKFLMLTIIMRYVYLKPYNYFINSQLCGRLNPSQIGGIICCIANDYETRRSTWRPETSLAEADHFPRGNPVSINQPDNMQYNEYRALVVKA